MTDTSPGGRCSALATAARGLHGGGGLAVSQGQEVHVGGLQQRLTGGQEVPHVLVLLVRVERGPVPVQLVEDPLPGCPFYAVAGAIRNAVIGLREFGYSRAEIGTRLGVTRQAAQQRCGPTQP